MCAIIVSSSSWIPFKRFINLSDAWSGKNSCYLAKNKWTILIKFCDTVSATFITDSKCKKYFSGYITLWQIFKAKINISFSSIVSLLTFEN